VNTSLPTCWNVLVNKKHRVANKNDVVFLFSTMLKCQFHYFHLQFFSPRRNFTCRFCQAFTKHTEIIIVL